ncbi:Aspartic peptidase domain [Cinara cedri]|uniref:Aspartic peptidase domain n=1 Tax=Cinara cedri TaxID=506608 RepID=A0A5E4MQE9_9HEMI|nr:Aspartic peptidase domain [Cinara cedri]
METNSWRVKSDNCLGIDDGRKFYKQYEKASEANSWKYKDKIKSLSTFPEENTSTFLETRNRDYRRSRVNNTDRNYNRQYYNNDRKDTYHSRDNNYDKNSMDRDTDKNYNKQYYSDGRKNISYSRDRFKKFRIPEKYLKETRGDLGRVTYFRYNSKGSYGNADRCSFSKNVERSIGFEKCPTRKNKIYYERETFNDMVDREKTDYLNFVEKWYLEKNLYKNTIFSVERLSNYTEANKEDRVLSIFIELYGITRSAIIDTGSNISCIDVSLLNDTACIKRDMPFRIILISANNTILEQLGVTDLQIKINNYSYIIRAYVIKELNCKIVLGNDFNITNNIVINFEEKRISLTGGKNIIAMDEIWYAYNKTRYLSMF